MRKNTFGIMYLISALSTGYAFAGVMGTPGETESWTGAYVGLNGGYWWSTNNTFRSVGIPSFENFALIDPAIVSILAQLATNNVSGNADGFSGGAQAGYNYQFSPKLVVGVDIDIDGLSNTQSKAQTAKAASIPGFPNNTYLSALYVTQKLNYLGTIRGRIGALITPTVLIYGTGGFAYGGASHSSTFSAILTNNPVLTPLPISNMVSMSQLLTGWAAGGGAEWKFRPHWLTRLEFLYYNLGSINYNTTITQFSTVSPPPVPFPPVPFISAIVSSSASFAESVVRAGISYQFDI